MVETMDSRLTARQKDALDVLSQCDGWLTPAAFAAKFWPEKQWARVNGPWGLGPDASGCHGGRMLSRLSRLGLVDIREYGAGYEARISRAGRLAIGLEL